MNKRIASLYEYTANGLRQRPLLVIVLLLVLFVILQYKFYHFTRKTLPCVQSAYDEDGVLYGHAHEVLSGIIFLLALIGMLRLGAINRALRRKVTRRYKEISEKGHPGEKQKYRATVAQLRFKGNLYQKLSKLVEVAPHSFLNALLALTLIILSLQAFRCCKYKSAVCLYGEDSWLFSACFYLPWVIVVSLILYMIFNDFHVSDQLERYLDKHISGGMDWNVHIARFIDLLTPTEKQYFHDRFVMKISRKEIARKNHVEISTVKTHINNIKTKKWEAYLQEAGLPFVELHNMPLHLSPPPGFPKST